MTEKLRAVLPEQEKEKQFTTLFELFNNRLGLFTRDMLFVVTRYSKFLLPGGDGWKASVICLSSRYFISHRKK